MTRRTNMKQLEEKDIQILYEINNFRFITMEQFRMISQYGKSYVYEKSREYQRMGVLKKSSLKGEITEQGRRKHKIYLEVTQSGMNLIEKHGYKVTSTARENASIRRERLLALLQINDIALNLLPYRWGFLDGRDTKRRYNTTIKNALLHGMLESPDKERDYGLYMLLNEDNEKIVDVIKRQTPDIKNLTNYIIATRTAKAIPKVIKDLDSKKVRFHRKSLPRLHVGGKLCVLPKDFIQMYLPISKIVKEKHKKFIEALGFQILADMDNKNVVNKHRLSKHQFDYIVRYEDYAEYRGEDFYLVDMLDNDLTKLRNIARYNGDSTYRDDARKVLVITSNQTFHKPIHELYLRGKHFIFLPIKLNGISNFKKRMYPDVVVPERNLRTSNG